MALAKHGLLLSLLIVFVHLPQQNVGDFFDGFTCKTVLAVSCRGVIWGAGAAGGAAAGGPIGAGIGGAAASVLSEVCTPISEKVCDKRRRKLIAPAVMEAFDKRNTILRLPQSFDDYVSQDGKISLEYFIAGVQKALPSHLHHASVLAKAFDDADLNDDGYLDRNEFSKGPWIAKEQDVDAMKREIIARVLPY